MSTSRAVPSAILKNNKERIKKKTITRDTAWFLKLSHSRNCNDLTFQRRKQHIHGHRSAFERRQKMEVLAIR